MVRIERSAEHGFVIAYSDPAGGRVRVAWKDSVWHREEVPLPSVSPYVSFCAGTHDIASMAIAYSDTLGYLGVAEDSFGEWRYRPSRISMSGPLLVQDTSGRAIVYSALDGSGQHMPLVRAIYSSVWLLDTVWIPQFYNYCEVFDAVVDARNTVTVLYKSVWTPAPYLDLYIGKMTDTGWVETRIGGSQHSVIGPAAMALDTAGNVRACYYTNDTYRPHEQRFRYSDAMVDTVAYACALKMDESNRPFIVYTRPELIFVYLDRGQWHRFSVPCTTSSISKVDVVVDDHGQPLIAFSTATGVWLARGDGIVTAVEEEHPLVMPQAAGATLAGRVLRVGEPSFLLNASGRVVVELQVGANDLSRVPAGVYFACGRSGVTPTKVVITR